jgi:hypothetical protein
VGEAERAGVGRPVDRLDSGHRPCPQPPQQCRGVERVAPRQDDRGGQEAGACSSSRAASASARVERIVKI